MIRIIIKNLVNMKVEFKFELELIIGMGIISVISTSKIRKTMAIRKNRREKGNREEFIGLNPHSKADGFSRSRKFFFAISELIKIRAVDTINDVMNSEIIA